MLPYQLPFRLTAPSPSAITNLASSTILANMESIELLTGKAEKLIKFAPSFKSIDNDLQSFE